MYGIRNRLAQGQNITVSPLLLYQQPIRYASQRSSFRWAASANNRSSLQGTDSTAVGNVADVMDEQEKNSVPEAQVTTQLHNEVDQESTTRTFVTQIIPSERVLIIGRNGVLLFASVTFFIALFNIIRKFLSPKAKRRRTVNKNRELIEDLIQYLPNKRGELTQKTAWMIRVKAGFSPTEVFRKYLWFLLRERKFDQTAVDDLVCLKEALQLSEDDVSTALKERAQRIYEKYGTLMLNTEGMTSSGIERKATCQALFSKILFLTEYQELLESESEAAKNVNLREIFGATEEDESKLRIVSLEEVDLDRLDKMLTESKEVNGSED